MRHRLECRNPEFVDEYDDSLDLIILRVVGTFCVPPKLPQRLEYENICREPPFLPF